MVSTRRTAHNEPAAYMAEADLSNTLRKKPVRRATTKKAETEAKPRTTRGKRTAKSPTEDVTTETIEEPVPALQVKPTRKAPGRPRKEAQEPMPDESVDAPVKVKTTRATKASMSKAKKTEPMADDEPDAGPTQQKVTRRTRAPASNAQPLSPKKITQVSRPQTRNTRMGIQKGAVAESASNIENVKGKTVTRKRTVSDENADVPVFSPNDDDNSSVVLLPSTPAKSTSPKKSPTKPAPAAMSEASMSSRATTPSHSPAPSFDQMEDAKEYKRSSDDDVASISGSVEEAHEPNEASEDELCGPKTPMRRSSPGAEARYRASVQKSIRQSTESPVIITPKQRVMDRHRSFATPRTQVPYRKPRIPPSRDHATTVARGGDRTIVFTQELDGNSADEDRSLLSMGRGSSSPYNLVATEEVEAQHGVLQVLTVVDEASHHEDDEDTLEIIATPPQETTLPSDRLIDADDTIILHGEEDLVPPQLTIPLVDSFDTDDTVLISRDSKADRSDFDTDDDEINGATIASHSPMPETIIWENIRQDLTIPLNFDAHVAATDTVPLGDATECPSVAENPLSPKAGHEVVAGTDNEEHLKDTPAEVANHEAPEEAGDATINLNDFIDLGALAEPTQSLEILVQPATLAKQVVRTDRETLVLPGIMDGTAEIEDTVIEHFGEPEPEGMQSTEQDENMLRPLVVEEPATPHYAISTMAFESRRKSLPALTYRTPLNFGTRPSTSDGASAPRMRHLTFTTSSTPFQQGTVAHAEAHHGAPEAQPEGVTMQHDALHVDGTTVATPVQDRVHVVSAAVTSVAVAQERYPRLTPRSSYAEQAKTAAQPSRFRTPTQQPVRRPATTKTQPADAMTPRASSLRPRPALIPAVNATPKPMTPRGRDKPLPTKDETPLATPSERFPRLAPRASYEGNAKTVALPCFRTPAQTPLKRPSTVQKQGSLRKVALKNSTPMASHTPVKTPLKPPAMTPLQAPMTPHPAAPLRSVVAMVEVYTLEGASASAPFIALLHRLGAKTTKAWSDRVTHLIFKDGSPTTLQRLRLHNKDIAETGTGAQIYCVNSRWVSDCDAKRERMNENDEVYMVDIAEVPRGGRRRRKSMEPSALLNVGGNIVRDRKSSLGRSSLGRSLMKFDSPATKASEISMEVTPTGDVSDKENAEDEPSSPATPAYLAAPEKLIQQTAPINRMRKLGTKTKGTAKLKRLTFFTGAV